MDITTRNVPTDHYTLYTVQCTMNTVHCTLYSVHCTLYSVHCTVYNVHCTVYIISLFTNYYEVIKQRIQYARNLQITYTLQCTVYTVHCTLYSVHCIFILYTVYFTLSIQLYTVHCTVCVVQFIDNTIWCRYKCVATTLQMHIVRRTISYNVVQCTSIIHTPFVHTRYSYREHDAIA